MELSWKWIPGMARYRFVADGFTLLEVLVALAVVGAVAVAGIEGIGLGAAARARAAPHADLRLLAESKLAQVSLLPGSELARLSGVTRGSFEGPFEDATWVLRVEEEEAGSGLFRIELRVRRDDAELQVSTYLNRFGELWAKRRRTAGSQEER